MFFFLLSTVWSKFSLCHRFGNFYTQEAVQGESKNITGQIEAAVRQVTNEIKDQLGDINQTINTNPLYRGKFFLLVQLRCSCFAIPFTEGICACFYFRQNLINPCSWVIAVSRKGNIFYFPTYYMEKSRIHCVADIKLWLFILVGQKRLSCVRCAGWLVGSGFMWKTCFNSLHLKGLR